MEIIIFRAQFKVICHLLGLTSSLVPFPKMKEKPCPSHNDYLSIKNLPTQLSPTQSLPEEGNLQCISSSIMHTGLRFSCLKKLSLPLFLVLRFCCHSLSSSCSIRAPELTQASSPSGLLPPPPDCTYRAAQTIWFHHRRSNLGRSYSHSASGLCKNLPGLPLAPSQHYKRPRTQKPMFLALG